MRDSPKEPGRRCPWPSSPLSRMRLAPSPPEWRWSKAGVSAGGLSKGGLTRGFPWSWVGPAWVSKLRPKPWISCWTIFPWGSASTSAMAAEPAPWWRRATWWWLPPSSRSLTARATRCRRNSASGPWGSAAGKAFPVTTGRWSPRQSPLATPAAKAEAGRRFQALALDQESAAVARACQAAGIPCLVVRAILDPLDYALPSETSPPRQTGREDGAQLPGRKRPRPARAPGILSLRNGRWRPAAPWGPSPWPSSGTGPTRPGRFPAASPTPDRWQRIVASDQLLLGA